MAKKNKSGGAAPSSEITAISATLYDLRQQIGDLQNRIAEMTIQIEMLKKRTVPVPFPPRPHPIPDPFDNFREPLAPWAIPEQDGMWPIRRPTFPPRRERPGHWQPDIICFVERG